MVKTPTFTVRGDADRPVSGSEGCVTTIPDGAFVDVNGKLVAVISLLGPQLRMLGIAMAAGVGKRIHHAVWLITDDLATIEAHAMGDTPDCATCREGVNRAVEHVVTTGEPMLVGRLYWAG